MNFRKMIAAILAVTMIFTSSSFANVTNATELTGTAVTQAEPEVSVTVEDVSNDASEEALADQETGIVSDQPASTGAESENGQQENADPEAQDAGDTQMQDTETPAQDDDIVLVETLPDEETEEVLTEEDPEADSLLADDVAEEEIPDETEDELLTKPTRVTDGFEVDGDGNLEYTLATDCTAENILLPPGVVTIPAGIFGKNDDGSLGKAIRVKNIFFSDRALEAIEDKAFYGNTYVGHVGIDTSGALTVGESAFSGCTNLSGFTFTKVTTIGKSAFYSCKMRYADLSGATVIGDNAFENCKSLSEITWGTGIEKIGRSAFSNTAIESLQIGDLTLLNNDGQGDHNGIGDLAFANNLQLKYVTLPKELPVLSQGIFQSCPQLKSVAFKETDTEPSLLTEIGANAFAGCLLLPEITLGKNVNKVGGSAFNGCTALVKITFLKQDGNVDIDNTAVSPRSDNKGILKGNGELIKAYAESHAGWKWEPLKMFTIKNFSSVAGTVTASLSRAAQNEKIYLTVVPKTGYSFTEIRINNVPLDADAVEDGGNLYSSSPSKQVYVFDMIDADVVIDATTEKTADLLKGELEWSFDPGNYGADNEKLLKFNESGDWTKIKVFNGSTGKPIGLWNFELKTTDDSIATISEFGKITALRKGSTNVTLSNSGTKISIAVSVAKSKQIATLSFDDYFSRVNKTDDEGNLTNDAIKVEDASVLAPNDPSNDSGYWVMEYDVDAIAKADHTFTPVMVANEAQPDPENPVVLPNLLVYSTWTPSDKTLATVAKPNSGLNQNLVTVKKGTYGDCFVEVSTKNDDNQTIYGGFIVRIRDIAPRMRNQKIQVNVAQGEGAVLDCVPVYGYDFDETDLELTVCTKKVTKDKTEYIPNTIGFGAATEDITDEEGEVIGRVIRLHVNDVSVNGKPLYPAGKKTTIKGTNMLYIVGKQCRPGQAAVEFHMPLNEVEVINTLPKVKFVYSGKINLLYTENNEEFEETNAVNISTSVTKAENLRIEKIAFVTADNYKDDPESDHDGNDLASNFRVAGILRNNTTGFDLGFVVRVQEGIEDDEDFAKDGKGKIVSSGYAKIKYEGYTKTVDVPISIPCAYTFPKYALSLSKVTASKYYEDPKYKVQIIDNGVTPKKAVKLYAGDNEEPGRALWSAELDYGAGGTTRREFFDDPLQVPDEDADGFPAREKAKDAKGNPVKDPVTGKQLYNDYIKIGASGEPYTAKARISFRMDNWRKPMPLDFNMTRLETKPTASVAPTAASLNKVYYTNQTARLELKCNLPDAVFAGLEDDSIKYLGTSKVEAVKNTGEALLSTISFEPKDDDKKLPAAITVNLKDTTFEQGKIEGLDDLKNGSYAFSAKTLIQFGNNPPIDSDFCPTVRFTINIGQAEPKLTIKKATFSLNSRYAGNGEIAESETTLTNIAKGSTYALNPDGDILCVAATNNIPKGWSGDTYQKDDKGNPEKDENGKVLQDEAGQWRSKFKFGVKADANGRNTILTVELQKDIPKGNFSYSYYVYNMKAEITDAADDTSSLYYNKLKITISCNDKEITAKLAPKGSINQVVVSKSFPVSDTMNITVPGAEIVYTATVKNIQKASINSVRLAEVNINTKKIYTRTVEEGQEQVTYNYAPHFLADLDMDAGTISISLNRANIMGQPAGAETGGNEKVEPLMNGRAHDLWIYYHIRECDGLDNDDEDEENDITDNAKGWVAQRVSITPKQVLPTLHQVGTAKTLYAGGNQFERQFTVCLGKTTCQSAAFKGAKNSHDTFGNLGYIKIADSAPETIRKAFKVTGVLQDDPNGDRVWVRNAYGLIQRDAKGNRIPAAYVTVLLDNPSYLVGGKTYTIPLEIRFAGQADSTKGTIINYNVTLVK
ncbi:MAG: leucine-rich repeat domain-containing protein [Lachnospiraceae bacterium]|nr:leucine-rich repeat domain-containing protein [Lachnospiraceae bacterium]